MLAKNRDNVVYSRLLMEYEAEAHIDQPDVYNSSTPLIRLFREWQRNLATKGNPDLNLQSLINHGGLPLPLACLAARVLSQNQIPFDKEKGSTHPTFLHEKYINILPFFFFNITFDGSSL